MYFNDLEPGTIIKVLPTDRSHEKNPYYAIVKYYNSDAIRNGELRCITTIPNKHEVEMYIGNNWEYHSQRMEIIGKAEDYGNLLYNQKFEYFK